MPNDSQGPQGHQPRNGRREQRPAFQFYPQDFLASDSVAQMSPAEVGHYILLLCRSWVGPGLPTDRDRLARLMGVSRGECDELMAGPLGDCWEERDGRLWNPRQERERGRLAALSAARRKAGSRGGKAKAAAKQTPSIATALPEQSDGKGAGLGWAGLGVSGEGSGEPPPGDPPALGKGERDLERALRGAFDLDPATVDLLRQWARHRDQQARPLTATTVGRLILAARRDAAGLRSRLETSLDSGTTALMDRAQAKPGAPRETQFERAHRSLDELDAFLAKQFPDPPTNGALRP